MNAPRVVVRHMWRQPRRTIMTVLTLAVASFVYAILASVPSSIDAIVKEHSDTLRVIVYNRTARWAGVPFRYCSSIKQMPGVVDCLGLVSWPAIYRDPNDLVTVLATDTNVGNVFPDYYLSADSNNQFNADRRAAVAGPLLMRKYRWKVGQQITLVGDSSRLKMTFILVGVIPSESYPNILLIRRDYLREARKAIGEPENDRGRLLAVRVDRAEDVPRVIREIDASFHNSDFETRSITEAGAIATTISAIGDLRVIVYSLCTIVLVTMLLIVSNSTAMAARDRLVELAVMRALGFTRFQVGALLFGECTGAGVIGGGIGAALALWLFAGGVNLGAVLGGLAGELSVGPATALEALVVTASLGALSSVFPILSAIRSAPALAFRRTV